MQPSPSPDRWTPPPRLPRARTRRGEPRAYAPERLSPTAARARRSQQTPESVETLADAGRTGSALRRRFKDYGIDPKLARLVLLFYGRSQLRVAEVAWALNVSSPTASRWLDRAEREGLL